jgi:hypothetical protein
MAATTPAKRTRPRAATPAKPVVTLDLDAMPKSKAFPNLDIPAEPFSFLLNKVVYKLSDPRDADWKSALALSRNPFLLMRTMLIGADDPVDDPTEEEAKACRERHGVTQETPDEGSDAAKLEAELWPDGVPAPALIDRFTCAPLPGWKLEALFQNWRAHFKIDLGDGQGIIAAMLGAS